MTLRALRVALGALALVLLPLTAFAQQRGDRGEFERLVRGAVQAYEAGDSRAAVLSLDRAYALRPIPRLLYNLGRAWELGGDFGTAADYYRRFLATNPDLQAATIAREALGGAERRATQQAIATQERRSAEEAERLRAIEAERARAAEAERLRIEAERQRSLAGVGPRRVTLPVAIAWGVAGAGVVAGSVLGALALTAQGDFADSRQGDIRADAYDRGRAMALGTDIALGTAVVAGIVGLVIFLVQPNRPSPAEAAQ